MPKTPVPEAYIGELGLEGDAHDDLEHHGGKDRAVCAFALELIERLREEGHPIAPGSTGENLTLADLPWSKVVAGARLEIGDVVLEVVSFAPPCKTIRASFADEDFTRISHKLHPEESRVYLRVLRVGTVREGSLVTLIEA